MHLQLQPVTICQVRIVAVGHTVHWVWPVPRFLVCPPTDIIIVKTVHNSLSETCCSLLVEQRGGQEEVEGVAGDTEEVVPVGDIVWWSITLLARPSTCTEKLNLFFLHHPLYLGECNCGWRRHDSGSSIWSTANLRTMICSDFNIQTI